MEGTSRPQPISTKLQKIAEQAAQYPEMVFTTLMHHVDLEFLVEAYLRIKRNSAPGLSGITAQKYEEQFGENIRDLHQRLKQGQYRAQPLKRVWIEKEDKSKRPIAIPELEDKIVQIEVVMLLEPIYEQEFYDFSYGFRKGRNPHQALHELREQSMNNNICWIVDADISGYLDHAS